MHQFHTESNFEQGNKDQQLRILALQELQERILNVATCVCDLAGTVTTTLREVPTLCEGDLELDCSLNVCPQNSYVEAASSV